MDGPSLTLWESALMRYSPQQILCASFAGIFVLTLAFAYVVIDPKLPSGTRPYKNLSVQYTPRLDDSTFSAPKDEDLIKRCSLRDIDREIHLSQSQETRSSSLRRRTTTTTHPLNPPSTGDEATLVDETTKNHSADCSLLLKQIADRSEAGDVEGMKGPLHAMHDTLAYFKAPPTRDINQVSIFCKALVKHDGLDLLQTLVQSSLDADVQSIAQAIIEEAVPSIWS